MIINKSKYVRQIESINKWIANGYNGALELTMQFGKTLIGAIATEIFRKENKDVIIIVPSEAIYRQWKLRFAEYAEYLDDNLTIISKDYIEGKEVRLFTSHEIINNKTRLDTDLLIIDELHKFTSDERLKILDGTFVKYSNILALTGTYPRDKKVFSIISNLCPIVDTITEKEAIDRGWISDFIEYNLAVNLSDTDKVKYEKFSEPIKETLELFKTTDKLFVDGQNNPIFNSSFDVITGCLYGKNTKYGRIDADALRRLLARKQGWSSDLDMNIEYNAQRDLYWNPNNIYDRVKKFMNQVRNRHEILINNVPKMKQVIEIFNKYTEPTICFNESTSFADRLCDEINSLFNTEKQENWLKDIATVYHSKAKRVLIDSETGNPITYKGGSRKGQIKIFGEASIKADAIAGMASGRYYFISTVKSLSEGFSLPKLSQVITTGGDTNPTRYKQQNGRGKTLDFFNPEKVTRIINIYIDDFDSLITKDKNELPIRIMSRDKSKLIARQSDSKHTIIWVNSVDEIS